MTIAAIVLLGPPLGEALFTPPRHATFWRYEVELGGIRPEPTEHARFAIALLGPLLVAGSAFALRVRRWIDGGLASPASSRRARCSRSSSRASPTSTASSTNRSSGAPADQVLHPPDAARGARRRRPVSSAPAPRRGSGRSRARSRDAARRATAAVVAALFVAAWLLTAFNTDGSLDRRARRRAGHTPRSLDETFAVLNGRTPLADFHAQYGQLWPYLAAGAMALFGASLGVFTTVMCTAAASALLAIYATAAAARAQLAAGARAVPAVRGDELLHEARPARGPLQARPTSSACARSATAARTCSRGCSCGHLDGRGPRRAWIAVRGRRPRPINNPDFGLPALAATLRRARAARPAPVRGGAAARWRAERPRPGGSRVALVSLLTLVRAGSLPHFELLLTFPALFGGAGFAMLPMPALGMHLVVYVTFAAALVVGDRAGRAGDADDALTGDARVGAASSASAPAPTSPAARTPRC